MCSIVGSNVMLGIIVPTEFAWNKENIRVVDIIGTSLSFIKFLKWILNFAELKFTRK